MEVKMESKNHYYSSILTNLPRVITNKGETIVMDLAVVSELPKLFELFQSAMKNGHGYGIDDFQSYNMFRNFCLQMNVITGTIKTASGVICGIYTINPSRLAGCHDTVLAAGHMVLDQSIRNYGFHTHIAKECLISMKLLGFHTYLGESIVDTVVTNNVKSLGAKVVGRIPMCLNLAERGWRNSTIMQIDMVDDCKESKVLRRTKMLSFKPDTTGITLNSVVKLPNMPHHCKLQDKTPIKIDYAKSDELMTIFEMFRDAKENGNRYDIHDFETYDHFVHKFQNAHIFFVKHSKTNAALMACVITPSHICRSQNPILSTGYTAFPKSESTPERDHIWNAIRLHSELSKALGYVGMLTEVSTRDTEMLEATIQHPVRRNMFKVVAEIPKMMFVKASGYVTGLILFSRNAEESKV
ncbi:unnamed protein product [Owenia fusiformis]|uniref:Uncharacterized protein n=1 Tax=Owenia fusiformis TaxID=6347 RepID=A0A8J1XVZ3_OWEFU|nr:unnamed protein product [Owenia fusiformis]